MDLLALGFWGEEKTVSNTPDPLYPVLIHTCLPPLLATYSCETPHLKAKVRRGKSILNKNEKK